VEKLIRKKRFQECRLDADIVREKDRLRKTLTDTLQLVSTLERLKSKELSLLNEAAQKFLGPDQKEVVRSLLEEAELDVVRIEHTENKTQEFMLEQSSKSRDVLMELSAHLDEIIKRKNEK
jgi:hypothetical protein